jgi:hypothetical protein
MEPKNQIMKLIEPSAFSCLEFHDFGRTELTNISSQTCRLHRRLRRHLRTLTLDRIHNHSLDLSRQSHSTATRPPKAHSSMSEV